MKPLVIVALSLALSGCAGLLSQEPPDAREALRGLANGAAQGLLETPPWAPTPTPAVTILMRQADVDNALPITPDALNEALARGLLSQQDAPHVLDWTPESISTRSHSQWLLQARLSAEAPPLRLSDRTLQPYHLQFDLSQPGNEGSHWQWQASGAVDLDALPTADATESP